MRRYLAALTVAILPLSACGSSRAAAPPALTKSQAEQVLTHYQSVNNRANGALDGKLLATVETGAQLDMDRADYQLHRAAKKKYTTFTYSGPAYYVPRRSPVSRWTRTGTPRPSRPATPTSRSHPRRWPARMPPRSPEARRTWLRGRTPRPPTSRW